MLFYDKLQAATRRLWQHTISREEQIFWDSPPSSPGLPRRQRVWYVAKALFFRVALPYMACFLFFALVAAAVGTVFFLALSAK